MLTGHGGDVRQHFETNVDDMSWNRRAPSAFSGPENMNVPLGATMPFSRYKTADASLMEAMRTAFYRLCDILQLSCDREDPLTEVVVTKIVALAKAGERDPEKLCFTVLTELEMPLQEAIPRSSPERAPLPMASVAAE
jgi:hypothetical protein